MDSAPGGFSRKECVSRQALHYDRMSNLTSWEARFICTLEEIKMSNQNERNMAIIEEFRANAGKVGGPFAGRTLLRLHTTGAKSRRQRINPVA